MRRRPRTARALLAGGLLTVAASVLGIGQAQAATPLGTLPVATVSQFSLDPGTSFSDFGAAVGG
ncbi:hypothetical protein ACIRVK_17580 [Streptomyces sp. NPDC101152]|uniref:hypothetical protein n=1 Tax=Streptomyces sp. NPDC101152 TaxID=3366116 RepID=UPI00380764EF